MTPPTAGNVKIFHALWQGFNLLPEGRLKTKIRLAMACYPWVPEFIRVRSPIRASTHRRVPQVGETVIDAGAFPGDFTVYASRRVGARGRVVAYEPHPENFARLKRTVEAFGCQNVICVNKGLWSHACRLSIASDGGVSATIQEEGTPIEVVSLDDESKRLGLERVDFIKMDIEGAEIRAIEGCRQVLAEHDVWLAIGSYHEFEGEVTYPRVETLLAASGYQTVTEYPVRLNTYGWKQR